MVSNTSHVILVMATLACAIITPAAGALLLLPSPSVFAQQQEETSLGERENIANGIVSGVLDGSGKDDEDNNNEENEGGSAATAGNDDGGTNTQIAVPITDKDQRGANLGLNLALDLEEVKGTPECPPGFTVNSNGQCERTVTRDPECPIEGDFPFTFNPATDRCEANAPFRCEVGTFDPATNLCQPGDASPSCPIEGDFDFNPATDRCEANAPPICEVGTFNPETDKCEQVQTLPLI